MIAIADSAVWSNDVCGLSALLDKGDISATELLAASMRIIDSENPNLNAFTALNPAASGDAIASDERRRLNQSLGPLDGIPVAIKDNLNVAGLPCTWGSRLFEDHIPAQDEIPIEKLRSSGAVIVGKTNVPEFTLEGHCANVLHGVTGNPHAPTLTPGGSSGGSVAAVASGMVPFALGTDGGGSIRRPAAYTGLVGLKPSIGRIARGGGLPQLLLDFEVVGTLSQSVRDCQLIYSVLSGSDPRDHLSSRIPPAADSLLSEADILYVDSFGDSPVDPEIASSVAFAADQLSNLGHRVERGPLPLDIDAINAFWPLIGQFSLARLLQDYPDMENKSAPGYVELARKGQSISAIQMDRGLETVRKLRNSASLLFDKHDFILTPSAAAMPWPAHEAFPTRINDIPVGPRGHAVFTGWVNACGHPAISLPCKPASSGMPIGFQLVGGFGREHALLNIAKQYEHAYPWTPPGRALLPEISHGKI